MQKVRKLLIFILSRPCSYIALYFIMVPHICFSQPITLYNPITELEAAILADAVYYDQEPVGWTEVRKGETWNKLKWILYERDDGQRVLSFAGTRNKDGVKVATWDWVTNLFLPDIQFASALHITRFEKIINQAYRIGQSKLSKPLVVVGHSKAGAIVQYVGAMTKTIGWAFNSRAIEERFKLVMPVSYLQWANAGGIQLRALGQDPVHKTQYVPDFTIIGVQREYDIPVGSQSAIYRDAFLETNDWWVKLVLSASMLPGPNHSMDDLKFAIRQKKISKVSLPEDSSRYYISNNSTQNFWIYQDKSQSQQQLLSKASALATIKTNARKVLVVGSGAAADMIYDNKVKALGRSNVYRMKIASSGKEIVRVSEKYNIDLILGVKSLSSRINLKGQRLLTTRETAERIAHSVKFVKDQFDILNALPDDIKASKAGLDKALKQVKIFHALDSSLKKDRQQWNNNKFVLWKSNTLDTLVQMGADKAAAKFVKLYLSGKNIKGVGSGYGLDKVVYAGFRSLRDGRVDIKSIELTLDGIAGMTAATATYLVTHNMKAAKVASTTSMEMARIGRDFMSSVDMWSKGHMQVHLDGYYTKIKQCVQANERVPTPEEYFGADSYVHKAFSKELRNSLNLFAYNNERLKIAKHNDSLVNVPSFDEYLTRSQTNNISSTSSHSTSSYNEKTGQGVKTITPLTHKPEKEKPPYKKRDDPVLDVRKDLIFGGPPRKDPPYVDDGGGDPPPPPPLTVADGGSDDLPPPSPGGLGGVSVDPEPKYVGGLQNGATGKILKNRPNAGSSSWDAPLPEGVE